MHTEEQGTCAFKLLAFTSKCYCIGSFDLGVWLCLYHTCMLRDDSFTCIFPVNIINMCLHSLCALNG